MGIFNVRYSRVVESFRKSFRFHEHFYEKKKNRSALIPQSMVIANKELYLIDDAISYISLIWFERVHYEGHKNICKKYREIQSSNSR